MFHTRKLSYTRGILCGDLWGSVLLLVTRAPYCLVLVWQPPWQYVRGVTNLYTEPESPVPTLVPQVSEFTQCLLHAVLLRFLYSKHSGMKDVALCGKNHITLLARKGQQHCGPSFLLLAFYSQSIRIPCLQPYNGNLGSSIIPAPTSSIHRGWLLWVVSTRWVSFSLLVVMKHSHRVYANQMYPYKLEKTSRHSLVEVRFYTCSFLPLLERESLQVQLIIA